MEKEHEALLKYCLYYKGEEENPFKDWYSKLFWGCEKTWVEETAKGESSLLQQCIADYIKATHLASFRQDDNTPLTLKAVLYNRLDHWLQVTPSTFKHTYIHNYINKKEG